MTRSVELTKKLAETREERDERMAERIRKVAIDKINSLSDKEINMRVTGMGEVKFSIEASVNVFLRDFASFIKNVEHFQNDEYEDVKTGAIDAVLPLFSKKILEEKSKDMSKLNIAEKRQVLIDLINKQSFNLCKDNAKRNNEEYRTSSKVTYPGEKVECDMWDSTIECDLSSSLTDNERNTENALKIIKEEMEEKGETNDEDVEKLSNLSYNNQQISTSADEDMEDFYKKEGISTATLDVLKNIHKKNKKYNQKRAEDIDRFMNNGGNPLTKEILDKANQKSVFKDTKPGEPVIVKNDFVFSGKKNCVIRFVENNNVMPKLKTPEKYHYDVRLRLRGTINEKYRWLLSSEQLNLEETDALSICFRKNNRQYNLNRVVLQNIINGKLKKTAPTAMKMVKDMKTGKTTRNNWKKPGKWGWAN